MVVPLLLSACMATPQPQRTSLSTSGRAEAPVIPPAGCHRPPGTDALQAEVIGLVNTIRAEHGLGPVVPSPRLAAAAQGHACRNAAAVSTSHVDPDGTTYQQRLARAGYGWQQAAENTALGFGGSAGRVVAGWMVSPGHRQNILLPGITEAGLGFMPGNGPPAWVLDFGRPY